MLQIQLRLWTSIKRDRETILDRPGGYNLTKECLKAENVLSEESGMQQKGKSGKNLTQLC